jgi:hypothetical protein
MKKLSSVKDTCILSTEVERFIFQILVKLQQYRFNAYLNVHRKNTGLSKKLYLHAQT